MKRDELHEKCFNDYRQLDSQSLQRATRRDRADADAKERESIKI
jgi:hypothetical protein